MNNKEGFKELIRTYDRELDRKESLESKASYILGIISMLTAIVFAFIPSYLKPENLIINPIVYLLSIILLIIFFLTILNTLQLCLKVINVTQTAYPTFVPENINELRKYLNKDDITLENELYYSYLASVKINNLSNEEKVNNMNKIFKSIPHTIIILVLIIITVVLL